MARRFTLVASFALVAVVYNILLSGLYLRPLSTCTLVSAKDVGALVSEVKGTQYSLSILLAIVRNPRE